MKKIFILILLLFSFVQAQECKSLLDAVYPDAKQQDFKTMEMTMTSETTFNDFTVSTEMFSVIDKENKRMYSKTVSDQMTIIMILQNEDFSMRMEMPDGSTMPMPEIPAMKKQLSSYFDNIFGQMGLPQDFEIVSCDGPTTIIDIISGEQITILAKIPKFDAQAKDESTELQWQEQKITMIVDKTNNLVGTLMSMPSAGDILMLMKTKQAENGYVSTIDMDTYNLVDGKYQHSGTIHMAYTKFNQPIDESLFQNNSE